MENLFYLIIICAVIFFLIKKTNGNKKSDTTDNQQSYGTSSEQVSQEEINKSSMSNKYWTDPPKAWWEKQSTRWHETQNPVQTLLGMAKNDDAWAYWELYMIFTDAKYLGGEFSQFYNPEKAFPFIKKAAELGHARAQVEIFLKATRNPDSEYGTITSDEARNWLLSAADCGYDLALCLLGVAYENGDSFLGIEKDLDKAKEYYQKSADIGGTNSDAAKDSLKRLEVEATLNEMEL